MHEPANPLVSFGRYDVSDIPSLKTQRLTLRRYAIDDFDDACAMWGDEQVVQFIGGNPRSPSEVWTSIQRHLGSWALLGYGYWAICDRLSGAYLGEIGFLEGLRAIEPSIAGTPEAGWCLNRNAWGQGYATEALKRVVLWADETLVSPTVCIINDENVNSTNVAKKCAYQRIAETEFDGPTGIYLRTIATAPVGDPRSGS